MTARAMNYVRLILLLGVIATIVSAMTFDLSNIQWDIFTILVVLATGAQLFKAEGPAHQLYHPTLIFIFSGVILLQPLLFIALIVISHVVEWIKERLIKSDHLRAWYLQPFNIGMHILIGYAVRLIFASLVHQSANIASLHGMLAGGVAAAIYMVLNHVLVGAALVLARGVSWKDSGILDLQNLATDFVMLALGYVVAACLVVIPWVVIPALAPLYLIYQALSVPVLKHQASTDPKTGLWNAKYFMKLFESELLRASRYDRPLTMVVADLDFLRNINNAYGHLAGDIVLVGVAQILKKSVREYDVVARFGGEEFTILMPDTHPDHAYLRVESIRKDIEEASFDVPTSELPIKVTMSFGVSGRRDKEQSARDILHRADIAVYQAKIKGRNRCQIFSETDYILPEDDVRMGLFNLTSKPSERV